MLPDQFAVVKNRIILSDIIKQDIPLTKEGIGWKGTCPFHNDHDPSLKVHDQKGIFKCFSCDAGGDVFDWLEKKRKLTKIEALEILGGKTFKKEYLRPDEEPSFTIPPGAMPTFKLGRPDATYCYRDLDGKPIYYIGRYEKNPERNRPNKVFLPAYWSVGKKWINKALRPQPLYGLEKLQLPGPVVIVEGEKCRDALQELMPNHIVISWAGGVNQIDLADWGPLTGRKIILWPDNDDAGEKSINKIARHFDNIFLIKIPEQALEKWDVVDAIADGWSPKQIEDLLKDTKEYQYIAEDSEEFLEIELEDFEEDIAEEVDFPLELLEDIPGLVGELYHYIMDTSRVYQPHLSIAASLAAIGLIYGHKVRTMTDFRSNIYTLGVARTGHGKEHARECIIHLYRLLGLEKKIFEQIRSAPGLLKDLSKQNGKILLLLDEIGRDFTKNNNKNTPFYASEISNLVIKLYSKSSSSFLGASVVSDASPNTVDYPCVSIYGTTVKERLYESMSSKETIDGFLTRWLLFEADEKKKYVDPKYDMEDVPSALLKKLKYWCERSSNCAATNAAEEHLSIKPKKLPFTEEALELRKEFKRFIEVKEDSDNELIAALWTRAGGHADKIALCAHENEEIDGRVMAWAIKLTTYCLRKMEFEIQRNVSNNEYESLLKRVLDIIRTNKKIPKSNLIRKTQWLPVRTRDDILQNLTESKIIMKHHAQSSPKAKKQTEYYIYVPAMRTPKK